MERPGSSFTDARESLAAALVADGAAVEAVAAFRQAGIRSILLRGPSVARHLYTAGESRGYVDADLLIEHAQRANAERLLAELGFEEAAVLGPHPDDRPLPSTTWMRGASEVDLHWTIIGARVPPDAVWQVLAKETVEFDVLRVTVEGLTAPATALVIALHAAHHGPEVPRTLSDVERGVERLKPEAWREAATLAERLDAMPAFALGLRLVPAGSELARNLGLPDQPTVEALLRATGASPTALGFEWLARVPTGRAKARLIVSKVVPERRFMRAWFPPARGGSGLALALGYVWRPLWLLLHAGPGLVAWRRARTDAGHRR